MKGWVVYRMYDGEEQLLYVGMTYSLWDRLRAHRNQWTWPNVAKVVIERCRDKTHALEVEAQAIRAEAPLHNRSKRHTAHRPELFLAGNGRDSSSVRHPVRGPERGEGKDRVHGRTDASPVRARVGVSAHALPRARRRVRDSDPFAGCEHLRLVITPYVLEPPSVETQEVDW